MALEKSTEATEIINSSKMPVMSGLCVLPPGHPTIEVARDSF